MIYEEPKVDVIEFAEGEIVRTSLNNGGNSDNSDETKFWG